MATLKHYTTACAVSSAILRLASYIFLRWIPGHHFPPIIFTALAIYTASYFVLYLSKPVFKEVAHQSTVSTVTDYANARDEALDKPMRPPVVEATDTIIYKRSNPHFLRTLISGVPSPAKWKQSALTFLINLLLATATWDLTFRSEKYHQSHDLSFARVGHVAHDSARLVLRESNAEKWPVVVWYTPEEVGTEGRGQATMVDNIPSFDEDTDWTKTITIPRLEAQKMYRYSTSNNHTGTFTTAPAPGTYPESGEFTFLHTSCIKARFPYNPFEHPLAIKGFRVLGELLPKLKASFMLFLGDWIYIDVPRRPGTDKESYNRHYRQVYASPDWPAAGADLPWMHVFDDHEIANDWDRGKTGVYEAAITPFTNYQHYANPPSVRPAETYYSFNWGASASFFLTDTRSYRSPNNAPDGPGKSMLGEQQRRDLLDWIRKEEEGGPQWKFIVSSVPFTKNWHYASANDTWAAYLWERKQILEAAWSVGGHAGVVILSGDRHEFAATKFPPPKGSGWEHDEREERGLDVWEFSCSPLSQFYLPVRTYHQTDEEDVAVKYVPDGNVKFGAVTIDTTNAEQAVLKYRLFVDGEVKWSYVLTAPVRGKKDVRAT